MSTIDLVYFNAGGGHLASAQALSGVLQAQDSGWQVRLVNLFEVIDPQDRFRKLTGSAPEDWYNRAPEPGDSKASQRALLAYCWTITGWMSKTCWVLGSTTTRTQWIDGLPKVCTRVRLGSSLAGL